MTSSSTSSSSSSSIRTNEVTLSKEWDIFAYNLAQNTFYGASIGLLLSCVIMSKRRALMVSFGSGIGVGIAWRNASQTLLFENKFPSNPSLKIFPNVYERICDQYRQTFPGQT